MLGTSRARPLSSIGVGVLVAAGLALVPASASSTTRAVDTAVDDLGDQVVYVQVVRDYSEPAARFTLHRMRPDGTGDVALTSNTDDESPAWSPDGSRIAYQHDGAIWTMDTAGGDVRRVVANPIDDPFRRRGGAIGYSPDGENLVFASAAGLRIVDVDGGTPTQLTADPADAYPDWSPDGELIVFDRNGDGLVVAPEGGTPRLLLSDAKSPRWSPDGSKLLFLGAPVGGDRGSTPYLADADGTRRQALAYRQFFVPPATWSPDGQGFAIGRDSNAGTFIAKGDVSGSELAFIGALDVNRIAPDWRPRAGAVTPDPTYDATSTFSGPVQVEATESALRSAQATANRRRVVEYVRGRVRGRDVTVSGAALIVTSGRASAVRSSRAERQVEQAWTASCSSEVSQAAADECAASAARSGAQAEAARLWLASVRATAVRQAASLAARAASAGAAAAARRAVITPAMVRAAKVRARRAAIARLRALQR